MCPRAERLVSSRAEVHTPSPGSSARPQSYQLPGEVQLAALPGTFPAASSLCLTSWKLFVTCRQLHTPGTWAQAGPQGKDPMHGQLL